MAAYSQLKVPKVKLDEWQDILDHLCRLIQIPAVLIMRIHATKIEVCVTSNSQGNPYNVGDSESLKGNLYCETVIKTQQELLVSNALKDPDWDKNPDIALGMISYCGLPINWPDGTPFGTICLLDHKENSYSEMQRDLLQLFKKSIEVSLSLIVEQHFLEKKVNERTAQLQKLNKSFSYLVDQQEATELALKQQASYDSITQLPRIHYLETRFNQEQSNDTQQLGLIHLRISNFIALRDILGLAQCNRLKVLLAKKIKRLNIQNISIAALSENEFCFLLIGEKEFFIDQAIHTATILSKKIRGKVTIDEQNFNIETAIGLSIHNNGDGDFMDLLRQASLATSHCANKHSQFEFYANEFKFQLNDRLRMEALMCNALEAQEFHVEYQPFVDINSGKVIGAEALLRWESPVLGRVAPQQFIKAAENSGLIHELGYFVLRTAIEQVSYWNNTYDSTFYVAVNLSAIQFKDQSLPAKIKQLLNFYDVSPKALEVELTENVFFEDEKSTLDSLNTMQKLGTDISLDDFGTGFSSLSYLTKFPFSKVKIDRSFIMDIEYSKRSKQLVSAIISMTNSLGLSVVAEGIENLQQAQIVKEQHANIWQGYYYGKPVKAADFAQAHFSPNTSN